MTPPAAAPSTAHARVRRSPAPRGPRRVSGPARPRSAPARRGAPRVRGGAVALPLPLRVARRAARLGDARVLDRLVRGRAWIAIVAVGLMGIVFMQVSMLKLNAGIGRAVTSAETLERQNAELRAHNAELEGGERLQGVATELGMVMPAAGDVRFLAARYASAARAARSITAPDPVTPGTTLAAAPATAAPAAASPVAGAPAGTAAAPAATTQPQPAPTAPVRAATGGAAAPQG